MNSEALELTINGKSHAVEHGTSLAKLLEALQFGDKRVAVERNGEIVPRGLHAECRLQSGDRIEIVHAIGGG